jgi:hypothetical protein
MMEVAKAGLHDCNIDKLPLKFEQYLHLATRLFVAASSSHDPLISVYSADLEDLSEHQDMVKHYRAAQLAVVQENWSSNGILTSGEYLMRIFEDKGGDLEPNPAQTLPITSSSPHNYPSYYYAKSPSGSPRSSMAIDRMSIDGIPNPQIGGFQCSFPGCTVLPFQTQVRLHKISSTLN